MKVLSVIFILGMVLIPILAADGLSADFIRGDADCDGTVDSSDVPAATDCISGGSCPPCLDAVDVNDDGVLTFHDVTMLSSFLGGGPPPPPPFPDCGTDPTPDGLTCDSSCCTPCPTCPPCMKGDLSCDGAYTPADVVLLLTCVFLAMGCCELSVADVDCSGELTPADVVYLLFKVFLGEPLPCTTCP